MNRSQKYVSDSAVIDTTYKVFPNDLNSYGTVFGGLVMSILDRIALVVAERHSESTCVTLSVDTVQFLSPAERGDILLVTGAVNHTWSTSMEIGLKVMAESYRTGERRHIVSSYFTFVALDENKKPTQVPKIIPQTKDEIRRHEEAVLRRENRFAERNERDARRASATS